MNESKEWFALVEACRWIVMLGEDQNVYRESKQLSKNLCEDDISPTTMRAKFLAKHLIRLVEKEMNK